MNDISWSRATQIIGHHALVVSALPIESWRLTIACSHLRKEYKHIYKMIAGLDVWLDTAARGSSGGGKE
jgi:hypothetical protein